MSTISINTIIRQQNSNSAGGNGKSGGGTYSTTINKTGIEGHYLWGRYFDATQDITGDLEGVGSITAEGEINTRGNINTEADINAANANISGNISAANATIENDLHADNIYTNYIRNNGVTDTNNLSAATAYIKSLLSDNVVVDNLTVTKAAHFFKLIVDEIKSTNGMFILSPGRTEIDHVATLTGKRRCFFRTTDPATGRKINNIFEVGDQIVSETFNVATGTSYNVNNKFYWTLATATGTTTTVPCQSESISQILIDHFDADGDGLISIDDWEDIDSIRDYFATSAATGSFQEFAGLSTITYIPAEAFKDSMITDIDISESVNAIGDNAFENCYYLTDINMPTNLDVIGDGVFKNCQNLTNIYIKRGTIGDGCFSGCTNLVEVTIPSGVTLIEKSLFEGCHSIEILHLPPTTTAIDADAFAGLPNLKSIYIKATTPPTVNATSTATAFTDSLGELTGIYVPAGTADDYADAWLTERADLIMPTIQPYEPDKNQKSPTTMDYHYVDVSDSDRASGSNGYPEDGDSIAVLGNRTDTDRQNAIIIGAYNIAWLDSGITAPFISQYSGINNYSLANHRLNVLSKGMNEFIGNFKVVTNPSSTEDLDDYIISTVGSQYKMNSSSYSILHDPTTSAITPSSVTISITQKQGENYYTIPSLPDGNYRITSNNIGTSTYTTIATSATSLPFTYSTMSVTSAQNITLWRKTGNDFDPANDIILDSFTLSVLQNGRDGADGQDGQDGTGTSGEFDILQYQNKKAVVDPQGNVNVKVQGTLKHIIGSTIQSAWTWNIYKINLRTEDNTSFALITPHPTNGNFNYSGTPFTDYFTMQSQPETIIVELVNGTTTIQKDTVPITFTGGAILEVTDEHIEAAVGDVEGRVADLEITASAITTHVADIDDSISSLEQTASSITTQVQDMQIGADNLLKRTSFKSKDWIFGTSASTDTDLWEQECIGMSITPQTYVWDEVIDEVNAPDIKSGIMFYRINSRENDPFDYHTDSKYISFRQQLYVQSGNTYTCRLKPGTWYTLSFLIRGANAQSQGTHIMTIIDNCKQGTSTNDVYIDGVLSANTSTYNAYEWYVNWNVTKHSYTFKTGSVIGENDNLPTVYFRILENSIISLGHIQLEESTVPSKWRESSYDNDLYLSEIRQEADNISISVTNITDGLSRTGIDIEDGVITLTADNTVINGNLNLNNPQDGFIMYDSNQQPNIILLNDNVALNGQKQTYNLTEEAVVDNIFIENTYTQSLGRIIKGSKLRIDKFNQWYQIGTIPASAFFSGSAKAEVTGIVRIKNSSGQTVATINTITYQTNATQPSATGLIPFFSTDYAEFTIPANDTYTIEEEITCMLLESTTGTGTTYHAATYYVNKDNLSVIGTDGFTFRTNNNTVLYGNANEIAMQNGKYNTIKVIDNHAVRSSLEYRGTTQVINGVYGDISTTPEFRAINTSSTNYVITQYDGVITVSNADIMLPADNSQIPVGKVWYIIPLTIAMGGGACHVQPNGNTLEGLGSNPYLSSRYKVYTLIFIGANTYVIS